MWKRALERYRDELDENDDYNDVINEAGSMDDVLTYAKTCESTLPRERTTLNSMNRLGPILKFVDDFSAVIVVCFGADAKLTAFLWGSIRLILTLASSADDSFRDVLDMLEELSLTLPQCRIYEGTLPMHKALVGALLVVYTEVICFYARAIQFFRSHPHVVLRRNDWSEFQGDFSSTLKRIRRMSMAVESEADLARMRVEADKYGEVLAIMKDLRESRIYSGPPARQYYHVPHEPNPCFWSRDRALQAVEAALTPVEGKASLKTFALYGMGGVGKTQIALQYANLSRHQFDATLWVSADNVIDMGQSMRDIAVELGLIHSEGEGQDILGATTKVKKWLRGSRKCEKVRISVWLGQKFYSLLYERDFQSRDINTDEFRWPLAADIR